jgi:hypothetical protein
MLKELSEIHVMSRKRRSHSNLSAFVGYWFDCSWNGTRYDAEIEFSEAHSVSPGASWILWRTGRRWTVSIGCADIEEVARFREYLVQQKGWMEKETRGKVR